MIRIIKIIAFVLGLFFGVVGAAVGVHETTSSYWAELVTGGSFGFLFGFGFAVMVAFVASTFFGLGGWHD